MLGRNGIFNSLAVSTGQDQPLSRDEDRREQGCYGSVIMNVHPGMLLDHWFYISENSIPPLEREREIASIVDTSQRMNDEHGITGCLIVSGRHFAQWIEGPADSLAVLRRNIQRDPRHKLVTDVDEGALIERQFASWSLGYFGSSHVIGRIVARPLQTWLHDRQRGTGRLLDLMRDLSRREA